VAVVLLDAEALSVIAFPGERGSAARRAQVVLPVDRGIARIAGQLLASAGLDSSAAVDALVVATAISLGATLVLTFDPDDLTVLAMDQPAVVIQALT